MMTGRSTRLNILFFVPLFLWTCGGGGSSPTEPELPQLPTVQNINLTGIEDTPKVFTFVGTDPLNLALSFSISTQPQHGTVVISGGSGTYTPNANYNGQDTFLYLASTVNGNSNIGTVLIDIAAVDDEPNTMDVSVTTDEDNVVTMTLEAEEVDGQTIQFNVTGDPSNGSVTISGTTATYTPNQDWFGTDTFNFEATDVTSKSILNNATGTITVNPINDAPTADNIDDINAVLNQAIDITLIGNDVENDNLTFQIVDNPNNGTVTISGNVATFNATSIGADTFTYKATDGTDDSNTATVSINISAPSFEKTFGGSERDFARSIKITSDGGYIIAASTQSFGAGDYDAYLIKTDPSGNEEWSQTFGDSNEERLYSVEQTSDGGYIATGRKKNLTSNNMDIYLLKTDASGNEEWNKTFGGESSYDAAYSIQVSSDGGYVIAGLIQSTTNDTEAYLLKTDASGNEEWSQTFGNGSESDYFMCMQSTSDGGYIIGGVTYVAGNPDMYLVKTDASGNQEWTNAFGGNNGNDYGNDVLENSDGNYVLVGHADNVAGGNGNEDIFTIIADPTGSRLNFSTIGGEDSDTGKSIKQTSDGLYITVGSTTSYGAGGQDGYLVKYNNNFSEGWAKTFGGADDDSFQEVQITSDGGYIIVGNTKSFGSGNYDIYLVKVDSEGNRIF